MAIISCFKCFSDNDIHLQGTAPDGARILRCGECGHTWSPDVPTTSPTFTRTPFEMAKGRFATPSMVSAEQLARVSRLKKQFLKANPEQPTEVDEHWARYREVFSRKGLAACEPQVLQEFATNPIGANPGTMTVFNRAWKRLGEEEAAERTRGAIEFLLRGPATTPVEDRLTQLIDDPEAMGMPGLREPLLTKVLCVTEPERFLPILTYGAEETGKRHIARALYGLHLPKVDQAAMRIGRLATWSNDLLLELVGDGFGGTQHAASFLSWATGRLRRPELAAVR